MFGRRKIEDQVMARLDPNHLPRRRWEMRATTGYMITGVTWLILTAMWGMLMFWRMIEGDDYTRQMLAALVCLGLSTQAFNQATLYVKLDSIQMRMDRR